MKKVIGFVALFIAIGMLIMMITHNENHAGAADGVFRMVDGILKDLGGARQ